MEIDDFVNAVEKGEDFAIGFEKVDDGLVEPCEGFVFVVATWIVGAAAVEDVTSSVARFVGWNALFEREGEDTDDERGFLFGKISRVFTQISRHLFFLGGFGCPTLFFLLVLNDEGLSDFLQIGISVAGAQGKFLLQIADGEWDAVDEVSLLFPQPSVAVGSKHLQDAEKDEEMQTLHEGLL